MGIPRAGRVKCPAGQFKCFECRQLRTSNHSFARGNACLRCSRCRGQPVTSCNSVGKKACAFFMELHKVKRSAAQTTPTDRNTQSRVTKRQFIHVSSTSEEEEEEEEEEENEEGEDVNGSDVDILAHENTRIAQPEEDSDSFDDRDFGHRPTQRGTSRTNASGVTTATQRELTGRWQTRKRGIEIGRDRLTRMSSNMGLPRTRASSGLEHITRAEYEALKRTLADETRKLEDLQASVNRITTYQDGSESLQRDSSAGTLTASWSKKQSSTPPGVFIKRLFPWVKSDVARQIGDDTLEPELLYKLRHPDTLGRDDVLAAAEYSVVVEGGVRKTYLLESNANVMFNTFLKAVPNLNVFTQIWTVYISIRSLFVQDNAALLGGYSIFLTRIMELSAHCGWESMARYIISILHERAGQSDATIWYTDSQNHFNRFIAASWASTSANQSQVVAVGPSTMRASSSSAVAESSRM